MQKRNWEGFDGFCRVSYAERERCFVHSSFSNHAAPRRHTVDRVRSAGWFGSSARSGASGSHSPGLGFVPGVSIVFVVLGVDVSSLALALSSHVQRAPSLRLFVDSIESARSFGAQFGPVGYELNLLYIASLIVLALSAASPFSFDRWWAPKRRHP
jgi:hypothetical protein